MTDEELKRLEIRYSDMESWDDAKQLVVECRRLREQNRKLVETCKAALHDLEAFATVVKPYTQAPVLAQLRAAIEGK